jgi:glycerol dehydrogenase-like iron-containing ADH family enzyme
MPVRPDDIHPFPTVFGRDLLAEVPNFVAPPFLVVTMADLWPRFSGALPPGTRAYLVHSMERAALEADLAGLAGVRSVVGLGGGQAIDAAKYVAWRLGLPLHQFPTSLSVDAMYGHRAGVREGGLVRYVGWAVPRTVYFDLDLILSAPPRINRAGIGDVLCFLTGVWDWQHAARAGRSEPRWPFDEALAARSLAVAEAALAGREAIRDLTPEGIRLLVDGFRWGGASYHGSGWCPRHIEGVEHYVFYALEARTGVKFLHGEAVSLGIVAGAMLHGRRAAELRRAIADVGVDIRPEAMGIGWPDVDAALLGLGAFVRRAGLPWGIAHDRAIDAAFLAQLRALVEDPAGGRDG